jgi:hypothetical protein
MELYVSAIAVFVSLIISLALLIAELVACTALFPKFLTAFDVLVTFALFDGFAALFARMKEDCTGAFADLDEVPFEPFIFGMFALDLLPLLDMFELILLDGTNDAREIIHWHHLNEHRMSD